VSEGAHHGEARHLFIGGEWVASASGKIIDVVSPYTEEVIGAAPEACEGLRGGRPSRRHAQHRPRGSVWTRDIERGIDVAKGVRTGSYGVDAAATMDMKAPFGGFKASGLGRECGPEGLDAYLETQTIVLPDDYAPGA
jgi:acyl-CoA reductase-like NAD-dependent aldehyde dehydrogenase